MGGITEQDTSRDVVQQLGHVSCLADPAFAGSPIRKHAAVSRHCDLTKPCHTATL